MSKAILVIDIPNVVNANVFLWEPTIEYKIYNQVYIDNELLTVETGILGYELLKPLPKKKDIYAEPPQIIIIKGKEVDAYSLGWNDCIDEILGGEK